MIQDKKTDAPKKPARKKENIFKGKSGFGDATFLEKLLFSWLRPFISRAQKIEKEKSEENILFDELGEPAEDDKFDAEVAAFAANYELFKNLRYSIFSFDLNFQNDALFFASVWTFKHNLIISALINLFVSFVNYSSYSQGINQAMTEYLKSKPKDGESGLIFAAYQIVIMVLINETLYEFMWTHQWAYNDSYTNKAGVVASVLVYDKLNKVSHAASPKELSHSELIKLTGKDARSVMSVLNQIDSVVGRVCNAVGISYFFINNFGWSFAVLLSLIVLFTYFKKQIDDQNRSIQEQMEKETTVHDDLKHEFLTQIKILKLYGWEQKFQNRIKESRLKNQALEQKMLSWSNFIEKGIYLVEQMIPVVTFSVFVAMGNTLEITVVMQAQSYFRQVQWLVQSIPRMWNDYKEIKISLGRIHKFLTLSNVQQGLMSESIDKDIALSVKGNFSWGLSKRGEVDSDEKKSIQDFIDLKNIDFKVKKGQFICVIGETGCGKTSLLRAILRDMIYVDRKHIDASGEKEQEQNYFDELQKTITGEDIKEAPIKQLGTLSYVEQKPWIQNNSIKDIILFNQPYDEQHYKQTIKTCQLSKDLLDLPAGDLTEIGENGINLSGGQRARISLARAVYANKDIMLMDDPFSALDTEVKKQIFNEVFKGIAKDKTRVLATNAVDYLHLSDAIVIMQKGRISAFGTFEELQSNEHMKKIMDIYHQQQNLGLTNKNQTLIALKRAILKKYDDEKLQFEKSFQNYRQKVSKALQKKLQVLYENNPTTITPNIKKQKTIADIQKDEQIMSNSIISKPSLQQLAGQNEVEDQLQETGIKTSDDENKGQLIQKIDEEIEKEADWSNLWPMIKYTGGYLVIVIKIVVVFVQFFITTQNSRQSQDWAFQSPEDQRQNFWKNIITVFALQASVILMEVLMKLWNFRTGIKIKNNLYDIVMDRLAKAPINLYFDKNDVATINKKFEALERVTSYGIVDQLQGLVTEITMIGTTFYLVFYAQPSILILVALFTYRAIYQQGTKEAYKQINRLSDCVSVPLETLETSSITGVSIIRAYQQENVFARKFKSLYERQNMIMRMRISVYICELMKNRPFNSFKKACILLGCMSTRGTGDVVTLIRLSSSLQYLDGQIKRVTECQKKFEDSLKQFQKVLEFMNIQQERQEGSLNVEDSWPEKGEVVFKNVNLRYRPENDLILKNLSFKIEGGMKFGVVGRSASGKSTTALAFPRLIELDEGSLIEIDGKDISKISLQKLRQKVTFILQEPMLFKGSLRFNLDPLDNYKDEAILQVFNDSGLQDILHKQSKDQNWLKYEIEPKGGNLSEGEKQLICFCRAILRKTKIIIMDEATANIDVITEQNLMKMTKKSFADSTVMTIAHRLNTIFESDQILMIQSGELLEQGNPQVLYSNQDSNFWKLCKELEKL